MPHLDLAPHYSNSIQRRFFAALAMFLVLSMTLLGIAMLSNQRQLMHERLTRDIRDLSHTLLDKGTASSTFLARIAPQGLLAYDYLLLEAYVEELSADPDIVYAVIFDTMGQPVTHFLNGQDPYFEGQDTHPENFTTTLTRVRDDNMLMTVQRAIEYGGSQIGTVEIGLTRAKIIHRTQELQSHLRRELSRIAYIFGGLLLISLVALILLIELAFRHMVVKPMQLLSSSMASLQAGNLATRAQIFRNDEIGHLAQRFNRMADDLQAQYAETQQQARAVQETRDYLVNILDHSADMIATTAIDGTIVEFNRAAESILGYRRDQVVGRKSDDIYCDLNQRDRLYATVLNGQPVQGAELSLRRSDNSPIDVEITLSPLRDNEGKLIGTVCIGRDVTHAKALRRDLIQSEKLASVGQVAAWIAHQIRNYLGRMLMGASALRPASNHNPAQQDAHANLTQAIANMDRLVSDLLDYSRNLTLHPTSMKLNTALNALLDSLEEEFSSTQLRVIRDFGTELPPLDVDVFKLEQALNNVLRNAVQAMPGGGKLYVRTRCDAERNYVYARIEDCGPGIATEEFTKIFRPFYTTKPNGTGLGLAMAQRIVEAHGGTLTASTAAVGGACFEFKLPCALPTENVI